MEEEEEREGGGFWFNGVGDWGGINCVWLHGIIYFLLFLFVLGVIKSASVDLILGTMGNKMLLCSL